MERVSIFDMDRTITRRGTWLPWLAFWIAREVPWRGLLWPLAGAAALAHLAGVVSRGRLKAMTQALLMGGGPHRARVEAVAADYAVRVAERNVFPAALAQLAADRAEGRRIVIATASNVFYARAIAARLGIADVVATEMAWEGERLRPRLAGPNCYGAAKLALVEAWLAHERLTGAHLRVYSDHVSDLPLLEHAAEPIAATPSPALRAIAVARGWRVVDWGPPARGWLERA